MKIIYKAERYRYDLFGHDEKLLQENKEVKICSDFSEVKEFFNGAPIRRTKDGAHYIYSAYDHKCGYTARRIRQ